MLVSTVERPNNGHVGDEQFVRCSEAVALSEVEMYGQLMAGGKQFVHCREVVLLSECPLSEVLLYIHVHSLQLYTCCIIVVSLMRSMCIIYILT